MITLLDKYKALTESKTRYRSGYGLVVKVTPTAGQHVVTFTEHGKARPDATTEFKDKDDAHEFAQDEVDIHRSNHLYKSEENQSLVERINMPQGHKETADPISDDSKDGKGRIKKMMGNRSPLEIIAKILAGK